MNEMCDSEYSDTHTVQYEMVFFSNNFLHVERTVLKKCRIGSHDFQVTWKHLDQCIPLAPNWDSIVLKII